MNTKKDTIAITFRLSFDNLNKLDELCKIYGLKRGDFLVQCVTAEYDKMTGNPELIKILANMNDLASQLKALTSN